MLHTKYMKDDTVINIIQQNVKKTTTIVYNMHLRKCEVFVHHNGLEIEIPYNKEQYNLTQDL